MFISYFVAPIREKSDEDDRNPHRSIGALLLFNNTDAAAVHQHILFVLAFLLFD